MKLIWQNRFEKFDLVRTSPLYYRAMVEKEAQMLNCYFYDRDVGVKQVSFDIHNGEILGYSKDIGIKLNPFKAPHYPGDKYVFGEYTIVRHGEWGYRCEKNGQVLWTKSLKGYLYTDITFHQGNVIWGTAGQGGHFYSLNIVTGEIVFDFNTRGTSVYYDVNQNYYFCSTDKKNTQILRIDCNGTVLDAISVEGAYYDGDCLFSICEDLLCVMTLKKKRKGNLELFTPMFHCVQLG